MLRASEIGNPTIPHVTIFVDAKNRHSTSLVLTLPKLSFQEYRSLETRPSNQGRNLVMEALMDERSVVKRGLVDKHMVGEWHGY